MSFKLEKKGVKLKHVDDIALRLTGAFNGGDIVLLTGDLGVGKTTLIAELTKIFETDQIATSPTFAIVQQYDLPREHLGIKSIVHVDAYRLNHLNEIYDLGVETIFSSDSLTLIEWGDRLEEHMNEPYFRLSIEEESEDRRNYTLEAMGEHSASKLQRISDSMTGFKRV